MNIIRELSLNNTSNVLFLLANGADPNLSWDNMTLLGLACQNRNLVVIEALIKAGANMYLLEDLLYYCSKEIIKLLLTFGFNLNFNNSAHLIIKDIIVYAPENKDLAIFLIENGTNLYNEDESDNDYDINSTSFNTLLDAACRNEQSEIALALIKCGINVNSYDYEIITPLQHCLRQNMYNVAIALIEAGSTMFSTPLFEACVKYDSRKIFELIRYDVFLLRKYENLVRAALDARLLKNGNNYTIVDRNPDHVNIDIFTDLMEKMFLPSNEPIYVPTRDHMIAFHVVNADILEKIHASINPSFIDLLAREIGGYSLLSDACDLDVIDVAITMIKNKASYNDIIAEMNITSETLKKALSFNYPEYPIRYKFTLNDIHLLNYQRRNEIQSLLLLGQRGYYLPSELIELILEKMCN